ncbi:MAG: hypothetical protein FWF15_11070, partial [Oscillospiraceae bacterium]|nr:hypothetical protein [Oscillospiraceae bacterium]
MNNHDRIKQAFGRLKAPDGLEEKILEERKPQRRYRISRVVLVWIILALLTTNVLAFGLPALERWSERSGKIIMPRSGHIQMETEVLPFSENLREFIQNNEPRWTYEILKNSTNTFPCELYLLSFNSIEEICEFFGISVILFGFEDVSQINGMLFYYTELDAASVSLSLRENEFSNIWCTLGLDICDAGPQNMGWMVGSENTEIYVSPVNGIEAAIDYASPLSDYNSSGFISFDKYLKGMVVFSLGQVTYSYSIITDDKQAVD